MYYGVDLAFVSENLDQYANASLVIANDLDMQDVAFTTIGGAAQAFSGKLNGQGHTIKNLRVNGTADTALFGTLENAEIKNLTMDKDVENDKFYYIFKEEEKFVINDINKIIFESN